MASTKSKKKADDERVMRRRAGKSGAHSVALIAVPVTASMPPRRVSREMMNLQDETGMPELKSRTRAQAKQQSFNTESRAMKKKLDATQPTSMPKAVWFVAAALMMGGLYMYHAFSTTGQ